MIAGDNGANPVQNISATHAGTAFLVLAAPFYLNDFAFIHLDGTDYLYLADYTTRALVLAVCFLWPAPRGLALAPAPPGWDLGRALLCVAALTVLTRLSYYFIEVPFVAATGFGGLFAFGAIDDPVFYWLDLTVGLLAVAASEELVFRKLALQWLERAGRTPLQILLYSSLFFSLMHWGSGPGRLLYTFVAGVLFMSVYLRLRRLWPLIAAHWLVDFIAFGPPEL